MRRMYPWFTGRPLGKLVKIKWTDSDLDREPSGSRLCQFLDSVDYIIILSSSASYLADFTHLRMPDAIAVIKTALTVSASLYTFQGPYSLGSARCCHIFRLRVHRILPVFQSMLPMKVTLLNESLALTN
jgi:hypothetical protein